MSLQTPQYPGVDPNANRGPQIVVIGIVFLCLSIAIIALRFFSRTYTHIAIKQDDWLIICAAVFAWTFAILCIVNVPENHYGQHVGKATQQDVERFLKLLYFMAITYVPSLTLSKLSLLALYWRIFRVTTARRPLQIATALNLGWGIAALVVCIFPCTPVRGFWDSNVASKCISYNVFYTSNQAFAIALDIIVLCMPVFFISNLQQSLSQKISISSTFLLGLVVTIVQGLRLWRLVLAQRLPGPDPTFTEVDAGLWAIIELNLWVVVASIPALRPLFNQVLRRRVSRPNSSPSKRYGGSKLSAGEPRAKLKLFTKHSGDQTIGYDDDVGDHSALKQEEGLARSGTWSKPQNGYGVRAAAPSQHESGWTPLESNGDDESAVEMENMHGIGVDREVEVLRPENVYYRA